MLDIRIARLAPLKIKEALIKRCEVDFSDPAVKAILETSGTAAKRSAEAVNQLLKNAEQVPCPKLQTIEKFDEKKRGFVSEVERLKADRNKASQEIARRKIAKESAEDILAEMKIVSDKIKELDTDAAKVDYELTELLATFPNIPGSRTPVGGSEDDNVVISSFGEPPVFGFEPKDHVDLGARAGILDFDRAAKISGARFSILSGPGARLERALINFMLDLHTKIHGYKEVCPPLIVNSNSMRGTGQLPRFEADLFKLKDTDYYLIPTAEVPLTNIFAGEILPEADLPIKFAAFTPCFRSEAGSYGRDTRGLIRQHQFDKVELVKFVRPENSEAELDGLCSDAQEVLKKLGLAYKVTRLSTGDLGFGAAETLDLEVWIPSQKTYREISSCSNFADFQARRANIRSKSAEKGAKTQFVHTINGSGLAVGRTWVALVENYQDEGGRIFIPEALQPYMDNKTHLE